MFDVSADAEYLKQIPIVLPARINSGSKGEHEQGTPTNSQGIEKIDKAIRSYDKLLLVLSEASMKSTWVKTELRRSRLAEKREGRRKLFPIRLIDFKPIEVWELPDGSGEDLAKEVRSTSSPTSRTGRTTTPSRSRSPGCSRISRRRSQSWPNRIDCKTPRRVVKPGKRSPAYQYQATMTRPRLKVWFVMASSPDRSGVTKCSTCRCQSRWSEVVWTDGGLAMSRFRVDGADVANRWVTIKSPARGSRGGLAILRSGLL